MWSVEYTAEAYKALQKLDRPLQREIVDYMEKRIAAAKEPSDFGKPLVGSRFGLWRYRLRDYRIICELQDKRLVVLVVRVGHRKDVYR
jgi:mRNA interferase RelE/StbE